MPINISRSIGYYRAKPGQNWLADDLQRMQDFVNRLESTIQSPSQKISAAGANSTAAVKRTVAPTDIPVVVSASQFNVIKTSDPVPKNYILQLGNTGKPVVNFSDLYHSGQVITPRYADYSVVTSSIALGAVTNNGVYTNDTSQGPLPSGTYSSVGSVAISTNGGEVVIFAAGADVADSGGMTWEIRKDSISGTILAESPINIQAPFITLIGADSSPASSQSYYLVTASSLGPYTVNNIRLVAINLKK